MNLVSATAKLPNSLMLTKKLSPKQSLGLLIRNRLNLSILELNLTHFDALQ